MFGVATSGSAPRPMGAARSGRGLPAAVVALILAFAALLICARMPAIVFEGRLWAEEGHVFFRNALVMSPGEALFHPYGGYLNLVANAATLLAARGVPLIWAPAVTTATGLLFQLLPPFLLLTAHDAWLRPWRARLAAVLLVLLVPASEEIWLQTLHCQFELALGCGIVLALAPTRGWLGAVRLAVLLLAPLCGPGAIALVPLFFARAARDRSRARLGQAAVIAGASALQLALFSGHFAGREYGLNPVTLLLVVSMRHIVVPFFGLAIANDVSWALRDTLRAGQAPVCALLLPLLAVPAAACVILRERRAAASFWLLAAAGTSSLAACYGALDGAANLIHANSGERYVYVPQALLELSILGLATGASRPVARVASVLVVWLLVVGAFSYRHTLPQVTHGPSWRHEVRAWQHDPAHVIRLWPQGWTLALNRP